ncbi:methionine-rich copper-binding protein CopC [Sinomonas atrocyanea]|uniref:copper resistance CopC family protein n=1 Tax=Sinomonas atrocyanea TaxID=37927 RepID=UPI0027814A1C|nr:copper resistance CopC family protein [Sinomonas atrocyanea]MDQ0258658.1 methionine-rich copper-binding protein CopC [Sinomonas atrocyanea]
MRTSARSRLLRAAASVLVTAAALLPGAAAQAHDVIESASPADGSTVATVPASVVLTFDHTPIEVGTEILVKDPTGTNQADGPAKIVDTNVTQALKPGAPAGKYTVVWRVVSADSHPIEGTFTFTAKAPGSGTAAASGAQSTAGVPAAAQSAPAQAAPAQASSTSGSSGGGIGVWIGIGVAVLLVVALGAFLVRRALRPGREE